MVKLSGSEKVPHVGGFRALAGLMLLLLTAVVFMTLDFRGYQRLETVHNWVRDAFQPVASVVETAIYPVLHVWNATWDYSDVKRENEKLRIQISEMSGDAIRYEAALDERRRLLEATNIDYLQDVEQVPAAVLYSTVGNFRDDVIWIDKGRSDGVDIGMAVVTGAGFVGRIDSVGVNQSMVKTIISPDLVVGVRLLDTGDVGLGRAVSSGSTLFTVDTAIASKTLVKVGSGVVTADSSRYPAHIPVGKVVETVEPPGTVFEPGKVQRVTVELAVDPRDVGFVTVLLVEPQNLVPATLDSPFEELEGVGVEELGGVGGSEQR